MANARRIYIDFAVRYILVIIAISVGAAIFKAIEKSGVESKLKESRTAELSYANEIESLRKNLSNSLNTTIEKKLFETFVASLKSVKKPTQPKAWTWNDGFHFAFTVMSTIGYGDVVPKTNLGKVMCMFYAVITIPLFLIALSAAGQMKRFHIELLLRAFETKALKRSDIRHKKKKIIATTAFLFIIEVLIASSISYSIEEWSFLDCVYFWVISASTIGFGDLVSDYNDNNGQLLFFHLLFTIIIQAGFVTMFEAITEIVSKKHVGIVRDSPQILQETSAL